MESEGPLKDSAPPTEDDQDKQSSLPRTGSGKRPLSKTPKESPGTDTCRVSNHDKDLTPAACSRQPEEEVSSLPERKVKTAKPSISAVLGKHGNPNTTGLALTSSSRCHSTCATHKPMLSEPGLAPSLLNTLAKSTQADQKKEPREVTYPFRKKTRTLYRSG